MLHFPVQSLRFLVTAYTQFTGALGMRMTEQRLCRALLGLATDAEAAKPALLEVGFKPFPWPAGTLDAGAAVAAAAFNLLLVFAFLVPTKGMVAALVREKELRLREGMRILGLQVRAILAPHCIRHGSNKPVTSASDVHSRGQNQCGNCISSAYGYRLPLSATPYTQYSKIPDLPLECVHRTEPTGHPGR